jgi:hypothetical protein
VVSLALPVFGAPPPEELAVLTTLGTADAATATTSEICCPMLLAPIAVELVQVTVAPLSAHDQPEPPALTYVSPAGRVSTIVYGPEVAWNPELIGVIVYVPFIPAVKFPLCDLLMPRTGAIATVVGSVAVAEALAPPPENVAEFVTLGTAAGCGVTVTVIGLPLAPAAIARDDVQVTTCPALPQDHPPPVAPTYVSPAGNVSTTVIVPLVVAVPVLLVASVYVACKPA